MTGSTLQERIHALNTRDVDGFSADDVVQAFHQRGILASSSPYRVSHARLAPSILNDEDEVDQSVEAVAALR